MKERTYPTIELAKWQENKRKMDHWHEKTPANPASQQVAKIRLLLLRNEEKTMPVWFRI